MYVKLKPVFDYSIGVPVVQSTAPEARSALLSVAHTDYILCVPPKLDFINSFTGLLYAVSIILFTNLF